MYAYLNFLFLPITIPTLLGNTVLEPILISISLKSKSDDTSYCCRVYHSPRNVPLFLKCSNNEGGKQMQLTY